MFARLHHMDRGIFLLLGSNLGDRAAMLAEARRLISVSCRIVRESAIYETAAWGLEDQPDFYNQVLEVSTSLSPPALLTTLLSVEKELGRERSVRWGPRAIDIDLLLYGDQIITEQQLTIPHPGIPSRRFVLEPLAELVPDIVHPEFGRTIRQLLEECKDPLPVRRLG